MSNYSQYIKILGEYSEIEVLTENSAKAVLENIVRKYEYIGITDMHYLWANNLLVPASKRRMKPDELIQFYKKDLTKKLPTAPECYLIVDCCDGRYIVCIADAESYRKLLINNYFDFIEIYFVNAMGKILLCVNHVFCVAQYT